MRQFLLLLLTLGVALPLRAQPETAEPRVNQRIVVGSKAFSESAILGEILHQLGLHRGLQVEHRNQLGGTGLVWNALLAGDVDAYPDYTGTIAKDILRLTGSYDEQTIRQGLAQRSIGMSQPLGFDNSYEIGMKEEVAERLGIRRISDLRAHPDLAFGFGTEFMDREDGWPGLRRHYGLPQTDVRGMEHALSYRALGTQDIHAMDIYSTDANIKQFGIRVLDDDLRYFPQYESVVLYRAELERRAPEFLDVIRSLEGRIDYETMLGLNVQVDLEKQTPRRVANDYLQEAFGIDLSVSEPRLFERIVRYSMGHLTLVLVSLCGAISVSIPLGVVAAKFPTLEHAILASAEIVQTIPGLALLVLLMTPLQLSGLPTVGETPTIIALFLYSLLPIIRNTYAGINEIPPSLRESAVALGLTPWAQLMSIELPMASRMIMTGIKTTAVINVGYATLGGLIGAGGYGQPILEGLYRNDVKKMLEGAIPAAFLALAVKYAFEWSQTFLVPKGLRIKAR